MSIATDVAAFKAANDISITTKSTPNSIPPFVVGGNFNSLADLLQTWYGQVFNVLGGTTVPDAALGADTDIYFRDNNPLTIYQKVAGTWVLKATVNYGIAFPNGPIIGLLTAINGFVVTVTAGGWVISNVIYRKDTATALTLGAADLNLGRYDLIYATNANTVLLLAGVASATPGIPAVPAGGVMVDIAFIPASSSGNLPYLLYGNNTGVQPTAVTFTGTTSAGGDITATTGTDKLVAVYEGNILVRPEYNRSTKLLSAMNPGVSITAYFL